MTTNDWLVVLTILKNMKVNGKDYPIYYGKIKLIFQTTNQIMCIKCHLPAKLGKYSMRACFVKRRKHVSHT